MNSLILFFSSFFIFSADYNCTTEFGELVPVKKVVMKPFCSSCSKNNPSNIEVEKEYPSANSEDFKSHLNSKIKKRVFTIATDTPEERTVYLDTGYTKIKGESFDFQLNCRGFQKCKAHFFKNGKKIFEPEYQLKIKTPQIFDLRYPDNEGYATIQITRRGPPGFLGRVFKKKAHKTYSGFLIGTSSSGETKFSAENEFISFDAGTDEQLHIYGRHYRRIATLELKVECVKKN